MEMKKLLETMYKFAGGPDQKQGSEGQLKGNDPLPKKGSKQHPAHHKLVGGCESKEPNLLKDLSKLTERNSIEWKLAEEYAKFLEDDLGIEPKRPYRKGTRHETIGPRGHKEVPRYKTVKVDEYGADNANASVGSSTTTTTPSIGSTDSSTTSTNSTQSQQNSLNNPETLKKVAVATSTIKSATGASATPDKLAQTLNKASTGQSLSTQDMQTLEPMMNIIGKAGQDPNLANQFKSLANLSKNIK